MRQIRWTKVAAGIYQAAGTSVRVEKRTDIAECWEVTYISPGDPRRWHAAASSTMREAKGIAYGWVLKELDAQ